MSKIIIKFLLLQPANDMENIITKQTNGSNERLSLIAK